MTRPDAPAIRARVLDTMSAHWRMAGWTVPNRTVYPFRWLWDSCFHSLIWLALGDERCTVELRSSLTGQTDDGFVPHMDYGIRDAALAVELWGRDRWSTVSQPPMQGFVVAELERAGVRVEEQVVEASARSLRFLLERRRRSAAGLVEIVHPWESGADDSIRWDGIGPGAAATGDWRAFKRSIIGTAHRSPAGSPLWNDDFAIAPASFAALVAFNALELASVTGDDGLATAGRDLAGTLSQRWDAELGTWIDDGPTAAGSGRGRSLEALAGALVDPDRAHVDAAFDQLVDPACHGARFGPTGVHRAEPSYSPTTYWRGPAWPQLTYLLWVAARRRGRPDVAGALAGALVEGAVASGFAEYWHPDTGVGGGAIPQSWTGLAYVADQA